MKEKVLHLLLREQGIIKIVLVHKDLTAVRLRKE